MSTVVETKYEIITINCTRCTYPNHIVIPNPVPVVKNDEEIIKLRHENERLRAENDLLKTLIDKSNDFNRELLNDKETLKSENTQLKAQLQNYQHDENDDDCMCTICLIEAQSELHAEHDELVKALEKYGNHKDRDANCQCPSCTIIFKNHPERVKCTSKDINSDLMSKETKSERKLHIPDYILAAVADALFNHQHCIEKICVKCNGNGKVICGTAGAPKNIRVAVIRPCTDCKGLGKTWEPK